MAGSVHNLDLPSSSSSVSACSLGSVSSPSSSTDSRIVLGFLGIPALWQVVSLSSWTASTDACRLDGLDWVVGCEDCGLLEDCEVAEVLIWARVVDFKASTLRRLTVSLDTLSSSSSFGLIVHFLLVGRCMFGFGAMMAVTVDRKKISNFDRWTLLTNDVHHECTVQVNFGSICQISRNPWPQVRVGLRKI